MLSTPPAFNHSKSLKICYQYTSYSPPSFSCGIRHFWSSSFFSFSSPVLPHLHIRFHLVGVVHQHSKQFNVSSSFLRVPCIWETKLQKTPYPLLSAQLPDSILLLSSVLTTPLHFLLLISNRTTFSKASLPCWRAADSACRFRPPPFAAQIPVPLSSFCSTHILFLSLNHPSHYLAFLPLQ